jgi:hypothetical protein
MMNMATWSCGEVKLPMREGHSPYNQSSVKMPRQSQRGIRYFFTWNVNQFVLWDRSLWDRPLLDRRVWDRQLNRTLSSPEDVAREENLDYIKRYFLPDFLHALADMVSGRREDEWLPPDDIFIHSLEGHLNWPVLLTSAYILDQTGKNKPFDQRIQRWMADQERTFVRTPHEEWVKAVDNMAKTLLIYGPID